MTSGAYSDYQVVAVLEWIGSENPEQARDRYLAERPDQKEKYGFTGSKFVSFLVREGLAQDLEAEELHLDNYGDISEGWERNDYPSVDRNL